MKPKLDKVRPHPSQNEGLIFEKSSPGKSAYKLPELDVPDVDAAKLLGASAPADPGILLIRAHLESKGNPRKKILMPDSAHGTNPATAAICGYQVENLKSNAHGMVDLAALTAQMNEDVAGMMLTNPSTLGIFEEDIH